MKLCDFVVRLCTEMNKQTNDMHSCVPPVEQHSVSQVMRAKTDTETSGDGQANFCSVIE